MGIDATNLLLPHSGRQPLPTCIQTVSVAKDFPPHSVRVHNVWALLHVESSIVSTFVYQQPVLTALMAISILGERPSARLIPSAALIAAGVAVTIHEQRAREKGPSPADQSMVEG